MVHDWSGMSDLISRQNVKAVLIFSEETGALKCISIRKILDEIDAIPSAEPERKKGKWEVQPSTGEDRPFIWWKCSVCGQVIYSETERDRKEFHAFCGRCGAEMTR